MTANTKVTPDERILVTVWMCTRCFARMTTTKPNPRFQAIIVERKEDQKYRERKAQQKALEIAIESARPLSSVAA